jgi:hypothetical protein
MGQTKELQSEDDLPVAPTESPRTALNIIAEAWPEGTLEPENIDLSLATKVCLEIESEVGELIESLEDETSLSHRESQVYVLCKMIGKDDEPLSTKSVGLYLVLTDDADDYISQQAIRSYSERIGEKVTDAKQTLLWLSHPNHEMIFDDPTTVWLESDTVNRLQSRARNHEVSVDTLIQEFLEETEEQLQLQDLIELYRDEFAAAQVAVEEQSLETGTLIIIVHTPTPNETIPDKVQRADVIAVDDQTYSFAIDHTSMGPQDMGRVTLFAGDHIRGMDPVSVNEGINSLRTTLQES